MDGGEILDLHWVLGQMLGQTLRGVWGMLQRIENTHSIVHPDGCLEAYFLFLGGIL